MKPFLPYKKIFALLVLLVQVFVSTPVQFYHQHKYAGNALSDKNNHATVTEICPVCNHHYTAYYNDLILADITGVQQRCIQRYIETKQAFTTIVCHNLPNKSPPVIA